MKRLTLFLLVACIIALAISGCFRGEKEKSLIVDNVKLLLEDNTVTLFSLSRVFGIELTFSSDISIDSLTSSEQMLMIHKGDGEKTLVALAKIGEEIEEGEKLLTIAGISSLEGLLLKAESEIILQDSATPPLPNGICVVDTAISPSSSGFFYVHGKGLSNVGGIAVTINYDSTYFTVDTTQGNNGVTALGTFSQGLLIVDSSTAGTLKVDAAFMSAKNISDEDMFKVHVTTKTKVGESNVAISGEVRDPNTNLIQTTFTGGKVKVGEECKLLGDFNNDCTVNLQDFIVFAQHYNSVSGDTRYGVLYDIHPAEMGTGAWAGIYCKATPDGQIKLGDFVVFANNYNKTCPPPSTPVCVYPPNGATNIPSNPILSWTAQDAKKYDVYFGTASNPPKVASDQSGTTYTPGALTPATKYYWKIVAKNAGGQASGSIWNFTTISYPDGISVTGARFPVNSDKELLIHGKNINNIGGSSITLTYDTSYFTIDTTKGNNGVTLLNTYAEGLSIIDASTPGTLKIDTAFMSAKNLANEDIYKVHIKTKNKTGNTQINITGQVLDPSTNPIAVVFTGNTITVE